MKGLMFNLLESLASDAGCSEEAWELVAEFAAADVLSDGVDTGQERLWGSDVHPSGAFEVPTEAMLTCLTRESANDCSLDLMGAAEQQDLMGLDSLSDGLLSPYDAIPKETIGGFGPRAFHQPEPEPRGLVADLEPRDPDADPDAEWDDELTAVSFLRRENGSKY